MVEIGSYPVLWHIMKTYSSFGFHEFIICLGYKGYLIKEYFNNYKLHNSDVTINLQNNSIEFLKNNSEPWKVTLIDTGPNTMVGGRIKRIADYVQNDEYFLLTYGDGVGNIDIKGSIDVHNSEGRLVTVTAAQPAGRFGALKTDGNKVISFQEKPNGDGGWINAGYFVVSPEAIKYIKDDETVWEKEPLEKITSEGQLSVYFHKGYWQAMDTLRDVKVLNDIWAQGDAPWKIW